MTINNNNNNNWRSSIGLFHGKIISNITTSRYTHYDDFFINKEIFATWSKLVGSLPVQVFFGLVVVFSYCTMVVTLLPLVLTWFLLCSMIRSFLFSSGCLFPIYDSARCIVHAFLVTNATPKVIFHKVKVFISYFKKSLSTGIKNFVFFLMVLQSLLVLSRTIELKILDQPKQKRKTYPSRCGIWTVYPPVNMQGFL